LIDTGSSLSFIRKDVLNKISEKNYLSDSEYIGVNGNHYITPNFKIPELKIGNFFTEVVLKEEDKNFWTDGCAIGPHLFILTWKIQLMYQVFREALIGIDLFQKFACIFDFPHSSIFVASDMSRLIESDYFQKDEFNVLPLEMGKAGVILTLETNLGSKRFLLDSAATTSVIRLSTEEKNTFYETCHRGDTFISDRLAANECDFGSWEFKVIDIASEMNDIDGILGIDFFKRNIIGFDFDNQITYIQSPRLGSKERFTYWLKSYFGF
jgi:hypothetical protein